MAASFHLTLSSPFLWYEQQNYSAPYSSALHSHPAWQLTVSVKGTFFFEHQQKKSCIRPGEWVLFSPELPHTAGSESASSEAVQIFFRHFPPEMLPELSRYFNFRRNFSLTGSFSDEKLAPVTEGFRAISKGNTPLPYTLKNLLPLNFLIGALEQTPLTAPPEKELPRKLLRVLEYMESHFAEPIGVPDFAEQSGLSVSRFNDLFRKVTGLPPMRYFNEIRLSRAQMALLAGDSVEEAAEYAGFASASYFCRCFKNYTGRTPGEFRLEVTGNNQP